jgi:hypothetical protein
VIANGVRIAYVSVCSGGLNMTTMESLDNKDDDFSVGDTVMCEHPLSGDSFEGKVVRVDGSILTVQPDFSMFQKKVHARYARKI